MQWIYFVQLNHLSQFDHLNYFKQLAKILQSVQFNCLGWFDHLKYFNQLKWIVQFYSSELSLTAKPGERFLVDCPGCEVEPIKLVILFFFQLRQIS